MEGSEQRNYSLDLLRIMAIYFVILTHCATKGQFVFSDGFSSNRLIVQLCNVGGLADGLFFMLSGYFLIQCHADMRHIARKTERIFAKSFVYSTVLLFVFQWPNIGLHQIYEAVFSAIDGKYWFITIYIVIYLFHPYINACLNNLSEHQYKQMMMLQFILWIVVPGIFQFDIGVGTSMIPYGLMMYSIGAYFRIHPLIFHHRKLLIGMFITIVILGICLYYLSDKEIISSKISQTLENQLGSVQSITMYVLSILFFAFFLTTNIKPARILPEISKTSLGVYLLHNNEFLKNFIWIDLFNNPDRINEPCLLPLMLAETAVVYISCSFVDWIFDKCFNFHKRNKHKGKYE